MLYPPTIKLNQNAGCTLKNLAPKPSSIKDFQDYLNSMYYEKIKKGILNIYFHIYLEIYHTYHVQHPKTKNIQTII